MTRVQKFVNICAMDNKIFKLNKEKSIRNIFLILLIVLPALLIIFEKFLNESIPKEAYFIFIIIPITGLIFWVLQRDTEIETNENGLKIIKKSSLILPENITDINYSDILRITEAGGLYKRFYTLFVKDNREIYIPSQINKDFDNFIKELETKLSQNPEYNEYNKAHNAKNKTAVYTSIFLASLTLPLLVLLLWKSNPATWSVFGIWSIALIVSMSKIHK